MEKHAKSMVFILDLTDCVPLVDNVPTANCKFDYTSFAKLLLLIVS